MKLSRFLLLIGCIALSEAAGMVGSLVTFPAIPTWYAALSKPSIAPPNWVFGPVWTTLFLLMGIALYLVLKNGFAERKVQVATGLFLIQLVLNVLWSFVFFGLKNPQLAFVEILILWVSIAATIFSFKRISSTAALLLLPYLAWVSFAAYLTYLIATLNP